MHSAAFLRACFIDLWRQSQRDILPMIIDSREGLSMLQRWLDQLNIHPSGETNRPQPRPMEPRALGPICSYTLAEKLSKLV